MMGRNEKYIYMLWKNNSRFLLEDSVALRGNTLLISREGYEYLKATHSPIKETVNY